MEGHQPPTSITIDLETFTVCRLCLRVAPLVLVQGYFFWLYLKETIRQDKTMYDRLDVAVFVVSLGCLGVGMVGMVGWGVAISEVGLMLKMVWGMVMLLVFLRFIFRRRSTGLYFLMATLAIGVYFGVSVGYWGIIPLRYSLMTVYLLIGVCCVHQWIFINEMLATQKAYRRELKKLPKLQSEGQEMLIPKKYEYKVLGAEVVFHLYLRRTFCLTITFVLGSSYYLLWDLKDSKNSIGQIFTVLLIEVLPPAVYYFFVCARSLLNPTTQQEPQEVPRELEIQMQQINLIRQ